MQFKVDRTGEIVAEEVENVEEIVLSSSESKELEINKRKKKFLQINLFAKQVIDRMVKDMIPPTPANYLVYFEKYLDDKAPAQKEAIEKILELEKQGDVHKEYMSIMDNYLKENFDSTKKILGDINSLYSQINKIKKFIKVKGSELSKNPTKSNVLSFENKISSALNSIEKRQEEVKEDYKSITELMKSFNKESIFDKKYEVYNKKYFIDILKSELESMKNFSYKSSLIAFNIQKNILKNVKLQSDRDIIIKTVSNMILDRSRRSDILAHYEDGIFLLILKHTDLIQAQKAVESIKNFVSFSNFIIDGKQIQAKINTNIVELDLKLDIDEIIGSAIEGLING
jgi:GGDEF domain-containing protein